MLTKTVDIEKTKLGIKELLAMVLTGAEVLLVEDETPIARLIPIGQRRAGLHSGGITTSSDFDEPLSDKFWTESE